MGLFRDMATLSRQGRAMQASTDVSARMAEGLAAMQAANAVLADQTAGVHLAASGGDATATIVAVRATGMQISFDPVVDVDLTVIRNGVPMPVSQRTRVPQVALGRLVPGARVRVKVDIADPTRVWIDWSTPL